MKREIYLFWDADEGRNATDHTITVDFGDLYDVDAGQEYIEAAEKFLKEFGESLRRDLDADRCETEASLAALEKWADEEMKKQ